MRGVSNIVGAVIVVSVILLTTSISIAYIASTSQAARDYVVRAGLSSIQPRMHLQLLYCDPSTGLGEAILTILDYVPDEPRRAIIVTRSGETTEYTFKGRSVNVTLPCDTDFMILVETLHGAQWVYSLDRDPDYSCLKGYVINETILSLIDTSVSPCNPITAFGQGQGSVGGVFVLNVTGGWWYVVNVLGLPYTIAYTDDGSIVSPVYKWDLDPDYIVFRAPRNGTVVFIPTATLEASYQEGFDSAEAWLPESWFAVFQLVNMSSLEDTVFNTTIFETPIPYTVEYRPTVEYREGKLYFIHPPITLAFVQEKPLSNATPYIEFRIIDVYNTGFKLRQWGVLGATGYKYNGEAYLLLRGVVCEHSGIIDSVIAELVRTLIYKAWDPTPTIYDYVDDCPLGGLIGINDYPAEVLLIDEPGVLRGMRTTPSLIGFTDVTYNDMWSYYYRVRVEAIPRTSTTPYSQVYFVLALFVLGHKHWAPGPHLFQQVSTDPPVFQSPAGETIVVIDNPWMIASTQLGGGAEATTTR